MVWTFLYLGDGFGLFGNKFINKKIRGGGAGTRVRGREAWGQLIGGMVQRVELEQGRVRNDEHIYNASYIESTTILGFELGQSVFGPSGACATLTRSPTSLLCINSPFYN